MKIKSKIAFGRLDLLKNDNFNSKWVKILND